MPVPPSAPLPAPSGAAFLREFLRDPLRTASLLPSSRSLAAAATGPVPGTGEPVVVELGPGTGAFTGVIAERLGGRGHHVAVELNPRLAAVLEHTHPGLDVAVADATTLPALLAERGLGRVDVVVSGLPWAAYPTTGRTLPEVIAGSLRPDGVFTQFGYTCTRVLPPAHRLRRQLDAAFGEVAGGPTVWANLPPAFVLTARRPRHR
ncbi:MULTISPECIES: class I SAM-dependent methyltransferase [Pseudonocardia]|uniref:16S ribosomal RNA methyltransferase KsgA/Dim1 family protein n=2 Tax=Pseudonocardia TaxID=1847 RepID=A0A1Y2N6S6_PSEAH|nr:MULTISPECIES: rRNA adenine N-6-methyltransferase family protein [Pseudonocardia]OSY42881.1 16S ribosomal RNA methyltransferase KsgA/Dim1 family protein [Pseudonocardia autotrophica]TDN77459.1 phospholipid N-methyltransferase [Pseudonocardia autotrophica]BBG01481.1 methyltransferase [Pseudonocardia autotrophica]GEC25265.1 methyltransferase [Pseudonocardia saturnea]